MTKIELSYMCWIPLKMKPNKLIYNNVLKSQVWLSLGLVLKYLILTIIRNRTEY